MTGSQRLVLMLGMVLLAGCLLYPPWHVNALPAAPTPVFRSLGHAFLFSAPNGRIRAVLRETYADRQGFLRALSERIDARAEGRQPAPPPYQPPPYRGQAASLDLTLLFTQMGAVAALTGVAFVALGWRRKP